MEPIWDNIRAFQMHLDKLKSDTESTPNVMILLCSTHNPKDLAREQLTIREIMSLFYSVMRDPIIKVDTCGCMVALSPGGYVAEQYRLTHQLFTEETATHVRE